MERQEGVCLHLAPLLGRIFLFLQMGEFHDCPDAGSKS
jgi:hypothetical protein